VDSGDPGDQVQTAKGYVSEGLARGLRTALTDARHQGKCRVVMLHHHPFDDGAFMKLVGADLFLEAVRDNCEIVLFGHDHHLGVWRNREHVPLMVASHKTTDTVFEHHLMINVIEASRSDAGAWSFWHRLELA
jgi:xanthine/CO dehydrogenase XdhC/CoxF family maturation factor